LVHLIAHSRQRTHVDRVADALREVQGAFSLLFLTGEHVIAVRDPHGFRPLSIGKLGDAFVFASEPPAFDLIAAEYVRDVEPGEMVVVTENGMESFYPFAETERRMCIFEYVYFARPDSTLGGVSVYEARKRMGRKLALESPIEADVVVPVPDSGVAAALGFSQQSGIPFELGLIRSHYVGRTFIEPQSSIRHFGVRLKLSPVREVLQDKRVVVVDDSLIRGTTSRKIVKMLRGAGAREVHLRISAPPTRWPCFYGIDTPSRNELIASNHTIEEIGRYITCDTLGYLSMEGLRASVTGKGYCDACFTGDYPVAFTRPGHQRRQLELIGI
jgi:amidophosphoribosyltransferase